VTESDATDSTACESSLDATLSIVLSILSIL
jgi:hypothetical protein